MNVESRCPGCFNDNEIKKFNIINLISHCFCSRCKICDVKYYYVYLTTENRFYGKPNCNCNHIKPVYI